LQGYYLENISIINFTIISAKFSPRLHAIQALEFVQHLRVLVQQWYLLSRKWSVYHFFISKFLPNFQPRVYQLGLYCAGASLGGILTLFLPETKDKKLPSSPSEIPKKKKRLLI
jgi:hypothetical protein